MDREGENCLWYSRTLRMTDTWNATEELKKEVASLAGPLFLFPAEQLCFHQVSTVSQDFHALSPGVWAQSTISRPFDYGSVFKDSGIR